MKIGQRQVGKILQGSLELPVALAGEADDDIAANRRIGQTLADTREQVAIVGGVVIAPHGFENRVVARLGADMQMRADRIRTRH